jgi:D-alanyl-D-alanine carboxypeptidase
VVAAEHIAGSEPDFVEIMNARAKALGMSDTLFGNASGLPDNPQKSTALDLAVLARKLSISFPRYYSFLLKSSFQYRGRTFERKNDLINSSENAHKLKTGFTCQAGYNLVATVERDRERLIGVILGARNIADRNASMAKLLNQALTRPKIGQTALTLRSLRNASGQGSAGALNKKAIADSCIVGQPPNPYDQITGWGLVVGVDKSELGSLNLASNTMQRFPKLLKGAKPAAIPFMRKVLLYRSYLTGLKEASAVDACRRMRDRGYYCVAQNPESLRIRLKEGRAALKKQLEENVGTMAH